MNQGVSKPQFGSAVTSMLPNLIVAILLIVALVWFFGNTGVNLVGVWSQQSTYNYCYLIPLISLYVCWQDRSRFNPFAVTISLFGVVWVSGFALLWLVGDAADVAVARQFAFIGMVQGIFLTAFGFRTFWAFIFPIQYLWLALPAWDFLVLKLQWISLELSVPVVQIVNIPTFVDGLLIEVPSGLYRVAPECSGLNFLLASAALSSLYGYLMYRGYKKRILCILVSLLAAILANAVRIALIIIYNHYAGSKIDIAGDHLTWGWGFFAIIVLVMIWWGGRFIDKDDPEKETSVVKVGQGSQGTGRVSYLKPISFAAVAIIIMGSVVSYSNFLRIKSEGEYGVALDWPGTLFEKKLSGVRTEWKPDFPDADKILQDAFDVDGYRVDAFLAYYATQNSEKELVSYNNRYFDEDFGLVAVERLEEVQLAPDGPISVIETVISSPVGHKLVWYVYWVGGELQTSSAKVKLHQARINLLDLDRRAAFFAIASDLDSDKEVVRDRMKALFEKFGGIKQYLASVEVSRTDKPD